MQITVEKDEDGFWFATHDKYGFLGGGDTQVEALRDLADMAECVMKLVDQPDCDLTKDAIELKKKLLEDL